MKNWNEKLAQNDITVGILGLGYVGLPLAREFASANISTLGFDIDTRKVKVLNSGQEHYQECAPLRSQANRIQWPFLCHIRHVSHCGG
jgi:UDP-N-acetyl-D-mannosaminuronate dehydrogenase